MVDKSEKVAKSAGKITFTEMVMLVVVALLTQFRNVAEYVLKIHCKIKVSLKANQARLVRYFSFTKREISAT